jgi:ketosteroid isomerase-like protein
MKKTYLLLLSTIITFGCAEVKNKKTLVSKPSAEILMKESMQRFSSAWNQGDAMKISEEFTDDAIRIISNPLSPIIGKNNIKEGFLKTFSGESDFKDSHIEVEVIQTRSVSEDIYLGTGRFRILNTQNEIIEQGKWGNVFKYENDQIKFLMESAHRTSTELIPSKELSVLEVSIVSEEPHFGKIEESVGSYVSNYNVKNSEGISLLFTENGIQNVNSKEDIIIGRQQIKETESFTDGDVLNANILGYKYLGNNIAIAYGKWTSNTKDGPTVNGQWGNLFKIEGEKALLIMESAGTLQ